MYLKTYNPLRQLIKYKMTWVSFVPQVALALLILNAYAILGRYLPGYINLIQNAYAILGRYLPGYINLSCLLR